jgi:ferredoxin
MPKVSFVAEKRDIDVPEGANLRTEALKAGVPVNFQMGSATVGKFLNCHGLGSCGSCHVLVKKGMENLSPKGRWEKFRLALMMATIGHEDESRLACKTQVNGDCTIQTNPALDLSGENFWQKPYPNK